MDADPWGKPCRLVMSRLGERRPIPGIHTPGRTEAIVDGLFPTHAPGVRRERLRVMSQLVAVTDSEVREIALGTPANEAPGPDGIPGEAAKLLAKTRPGCVWRTFLTDA